MVNMNSHIHINNDFFLFSSEAEVLLTPHYHSFAELLFADDSPLLVISDTKQPITVEAHEIIFIPPQMRHCVSRPNGELSCRSLQINLYKLYHLLSPSPYAAPLINLFNTKNQKIIPANQANQYISSIYNDIKNEFELNNVSAIIQIIELVATEITNQAGVESIEQQLIQKKTLRELELCSSLNYMFQSNPAMTSDIDALSQHFFMSKSTFNRLVKKSMGMSFHAWLLQQKMLIASRTLLESEDSIQELSDLLGFSSASHFSKVFKDYFNVTPSKFRAFTIANAHI